MKYIKAFNNSNDLEIYKKSKLTAPHIFLNKQNLRDLDYLEEYEELEYISSTATGGQYIDLGCKLFETTDEVQIEIKFNLKGIGKDNNAQAVLLGSNDEAQNNVWPGLLIRRNNNNIQCKIKNVNFDCYINNKQVNVKADNSNYLPSVNLFSLNTVYEVKLITTNWNNNSTHSKNVSLFCGLDASGNPFRYSESDIHYLKLIKGGQVIRNLVPVRRKSDNAVGLYDIENDHLYVSQGDDTFIAGPTLKYNKMYNILYLESTGTQWIDTLIHPTTGYGFELYGGFTNFTNSEFFGGGNNFDNGLGICTHNVVSYGIIVGTTEVCQISAENNVMHLFKVNSDGTVYVDNEYKGQSTTQMPDGDYTMNIFRHSSTKVPLSTKIYYCKIFDNNDNLVFDGVPVRKNGIGYMYDKVTKRLFGNNGTGNFILGPIK